MSFEGAWRSLTISGKIDLFFWFLGATRINQSEVAILVVGRCNRLISQIQIAGLDHSNSNQSSPSTYMNATIPFRVTTVRSSVFQIDLIARF